MADAWAWERAGGGASRQKSEAAPKEMSPLHSSARTGRDRAGNPSSGPSGFKPAVRTRGCGGGDIRERGE